MRIRSGRIAAIGVARPRRMINKHPGGNPPSQRALKESELV